MEQKIFELLNYCYSDSLTEEIGKLNYQLFIMSLKSMLPFENKIGCKFDETRYLNEVKTLRYYINGNDEMVVNKIKQNKPLTKADDLVEYKIIPIVIANTLWENIVNEVLKCVVFYTYSKETILEAIVLASVLHEYIEGNNIDKDYLHEVTKKRIIEFSIKDFYKDNFNILVKNNYVINFEKGRISYIMQNNIFDIPSIADKKIINYIINNNIELSQELSKENSLEHSKRSALITDANKANLLSFSSYLYKLRKGILDPSKLKYNYNNNTDLKIYIEKENFIHPILGKCLVINRTENGTIVKTKIGNIKVRQ